jgi:hypothetical protein
MLVDIEVLKKLISDNITDDYKVHKLTDTAIIFYNRSSFARFLCEFYIDSKGEAQIFDNDCVCVERSTQEVWVDQETGYEYII